jgi:hypothetical protein
MPKDLTPATEDPREVFAAKRAALDLETTITGDDSLTEWIQGKLGAILSAGSFDQINMLMTETGLTPAKSLVGRTLEILDFAARESSDEFRENSQLQKYLLVKAVDTSTGEEFVVDGGGDQFVAGLIAMRDLYGFPFSGTLLSLRAGRGDLQYWRFHDPKREPIS